MPLEIFMKQPCHLIISFTPFPIFIPQSFCTISPKSLGGPAVKIPRILITLFQPMQLRTLLPDFLFTSKQIPKFGLKGVQLINTISPYSFLFRFLHLPFFYQLPYEWCFQMTLYSIHIVYPGNFLNFLQLQTWGWGKNGIFLGCFYRSVTCCFLQPHLFKLPWSLISYRYATYLNEKWLMIWENSIQMRD